MKLILVDPNPAVCQAWEKYFKDLPDVEIANTYFEKLPKFDCMVSAANSFGIMDGGVDAAITRYFGTQLMHRVQERILDEYLGEQPVGTSMIVETNDEDYPFLAHTPTMRVPLDITHTDNVYLAMWAMLREVCNHNRISDHQIEVVACPGLGTATGRVPANEAARQMSLAYKYYIQPTTRINWQYAAGRQNVVRFGGYDGFKFPMDK